MMMLKLLLKLADLSAKLLWPIYCFLMVHESETFKKLRLAFWLGFSDPFKKLHRVFCKRKDDK